ncbi:hypothetical protein BV25DRAFT_1824103 [Artomyces pyxidatus]|uniref:Uncharacterized protein n=1 Tax=Artomyces pyxidatus TaxID=48021 RepID=A0ACB8T4U4_9AGAM|nr:hypothetical protein BV25DRAFT_1824103 [Artomyces pyxidatus]
MSPDPTELFKAAVQQEEDRLRVLHPTPEDVPGCMTLFDEFLSCNMVGKQFRSLYRYGEMAHCTPKFNEFKFCMSIKSLHPEQRRDVWIRHRAEWWARRRLGTSSESVWDMRTEPLKDFPPSIELLTSTGPLVD